MAIGVYSMSTDGDKVTSEYMKRTLGEDLDNRIQNLREALERMCILKAKAEAAQMLNVPVHFIRDLS